MSKWIAIVTLSFIFSLATSQALCADDGLYKQEIGPGQLFRLTWIGNNLSVNTTKPAWFYQFAGIKSLTSGFGFSNCTVSSNGYCLFSVSDTITGTPILSGLATQPNLALCLNGIGNTFSCEQHQMSYRFAYLMNSGAASYTLCPINSTNGNFGTCRTLALAGAAGYGTVAVNPAGTFAYVTTEIINPTAVFNCPINADGTLGTCVQNTSATFNGPRDVVINKSGTLAYVVNFANPVVQISLCPINPNGTFGTCTLTGNGFNQPLFIALNSTETLAYITNFAGGALSNVSMCPINSNGTFGTCVSAGSFTAPTGIALNQAGTQAYVALQNNTVSLCPINSNGTFGTCTIMTSALFNDIFAITLNSTNSFAYIVNRGGNTVTQCSINSDGTFGTCANTGNGFANPYGIALF